MALFDKMKDSISVAGQGVSQKAKSTTESIRIGNLIKANDRMIEKLTYQVGVQCVSMHVNDPSSEYGELFAEIRRLKEENQRYQQELQLLTAQNTCPQCGFGNNMNAKFCISCGAPLSIAPAGGKPCPKCGFRNTEDASFCVECGSPIPKAEPAAAAEAPQAESMAQTADTPAEAAAAETPAEPAPAAVCKNCGATLDDASLFCTECGTKRD